MINIAENGFVGRYWHWLVLATVAACTMAATFSVNGFFDTRIDAPIYAAQIESFANGTPLSSDAPVMLRLFKPLYAVIGGTLLHSSGPYTTIFLINIIFYLALIVVAYFLFKELDFSKNESVIGAAWIATAYPVLKYGLALGTDVSGWLLSALTILIGLVALRKDSDFMLCIASVVGFLGATAKETGVLGLVALCLLVAWRYRRKGARTWFIKVLSAGLPALILYAILTLAIVGHAPTFLDWLGTNRETYGGTGSYSLFKFVAVEGSTFGLYWLGVIYSIVVMVRRRSGNGNTDLMIFLFISTAAVLLWPLFISRVLFVQFLWVMPLALYCYKLLHEHMQSLAVVRKRLITGTLVVIPIVFNFAMFLLSSGGSLFDIFS